MHYPSTTLQQATILAERLVKSIPTGGAVADLDPKVFMTHLVELLASYPQPIAERSISALKGLPAVFEWMPSIAKVKETLDGWAAADYRHREIMERAARPRLPEPERPTRESLEEMQAKYGVGWGINAKPVPVQTWRTLEDIARESGVDIDTIPDAKPPMGHLKRPGGYPG